MSYLHAEPINSRLRKPGLSLYANAKAITGLEIGTNAARMVVCRIKRTGGVVLAANSLPLEASDRHDAEQLSRRLLPWLKKCLNGESNQLVVLLPPSLVDYETIELAQHDTNQKLNEVANLALQELLGNAAEQAAFDYWLTEEASDSKLHLVWTQVHFSNVLSSQLFKAGLQCQGVDASVTALARVKSHCTEGNPRLIVDVDGNEVTLVYSRDEQAVYYRNRIRFAEKSASENIANFNQLSRDAAETLLALHGVNPSEQDPIASLFYRELQEWLTQLAFEIRRTLQYLQTRWGEQAVAEVILCGSGATIRGLVDFVATQCELPVHLSAIPRDWDWQASLPYSPAYAQALALADYGGWR